MNALPGRPSIVDWIKQFCEKYTTPISEDEEKLLREIEESQHGVRFFGKFWEDRYRDALYNPPPIMIPPDDPIIHRLGYYDMSVRPGFPIIERPGAIVKISTLADAVNPPRRPRRKRRTLRKRRAICTFGEILAFQGWKVVDGALVHENGLANV